MEAKDVLPLPRRVVVQGCQGCSARGCDIVVQGELDLASVPLRPNLPSVEGRAVPSNYRSENENEGAEGRMMKDVKVWVDALALLPPSSSKFSASEKQFEAKLES